MTYDIRIDATTTDNIRLGSVYLRHEPANADKIIRLRENMMVNGWIGRPVILLDNGDYHIAFSGTHRLAAAQDMEGIIEAVMLPEDLTAEEYELIDGANDDDDLLAAFIEISEGRDDMGDVIAAMRAEVAANESAQ